MTEEQSKRKLVGSAGTATILPGKNINPELIATSTCNNLVGQQKHSNSLTVIKKFAKPLSSRRKRHVLSENDYLTKLGAILRRDFFPTLTRLEAQYDYLTALEQADVDALRMAANRLDELEAGGGGGGEDKKKSTVTPRLSLDEFQARYVTEDTAEFEELITRINTVRRGKLQKVLGRKVPLLTSAEADPHLVGPSKSQILPNNTKISSRKTHQFNPGMLSITDHTNLGYHLQKMVHEFGLNEPSSLPSLRGGGGDEEETSSVAAISTTSTTTNPTNTSQVGGSVFRSYDFVETPLLSSSSSKLDPRTTPARPTFKAKEAFRISDNSIFKSEKSKRLLQSPAVKRLLRAHTPRRDALGSAFSGFPPPPPPTQK